MVIVIVSLTSAARAQTPIFSFGAMQPSTGTGVLHEMLLYRKLGDHPRTGERGADEYIALTQIAYGIRSDIGLQIDVPVVYRDIDGGNRGDDDDNLNIADSSVLIKYRIYQQDPAPTETIRFSLVGGLQIPGNSDYTMDASSDALDPIIGAVFSTVRGRHGFNADLLYEFYTGDDEDEGASDSVHYGASYLFRISPQAYTAQSSGSLYAVAELDGFYDTNGDNELFFSPGLMYESRKYTLDAGLMIPIWQDLDYRAETEIIVAIGVRLSF
jgi:hypothetical protein